MQLYHESSLLTFNPYIDGVYGKFFAPKVYTSEKQYPVRIYSEIYGIYANLTKRFADRMDDFKVDVKENCYLHSNFLLDHFPRQALFAIAEEPGFWYGVEKYPWFPLVLERFYKLSKGELYLLADWEGGEQCSDRYVWMRKTFGTTLMDHTFLMDDGLRPLLVQHGKYDILIDGDLKNIERWTDAGGSGFWWPEMHWGCDSGHRVKIIAKRFELLGEVVEYLNDPKSLTKA
jgi:hypothetical protein